MKTFSDHQNENTVGQLRRQAIEKLKQAILALPEIDALDPWDVQTALEEVRKEFNH